MNLLKPQEVSHREHVIWNIKNFLINYMSAMISNLLLEVHTIFWHIFTSKRLNTPRWLIGLQDILLKVTDNFLVNKLIAVLDMEADYKLWDSFFIDKILIPIVKLEGIIYEEDFVRHNDHIEVEVDLWRCLLWDRLGHQIIPGVIGSTFSSQCYDIFVIYLASIVAQSWGLPLPTTSIISSTLEVMNFSIGQYLKTWTSDKRNKKKPL